jgi:predicted transglutaminase-like cysteine proteinase
MSLNNRAVFVEFSRSGFFARSTGFVLVLAALLSGSGASVFAGPNDTPAAIETAGVTAPEPAAAPNERQIARYFTINQVIAGLDGQNPQGGAHRFQLAALDSSPANDPKIQSDAAALLAEPFGFATFRAPEGLLWAKWRKLEAELADEANAIARCRANPTLCAYPAARKYIALVDEALRLSGIAKIDRINRAVNAAIRYTSDFEQYGVPDLWATPLASLGTGKGDCEDYAIVKYAALRDVGYSSDDLRLLIVRDRVARQDHAVVGVRLNGRWLMLDNRHDILLENKDAGHFIPLFALDQQGVKLFAVPYDRATATATSRSDSAEPAVELDAISAEALGLRLDTFEPPALRGGL